MAQGEATRAEFVSQLGNPPLLSLIRPWRCLPRPEVSSSGVSCCVSRHAEVPVVRELRSQQPSGDARDSQGHDGCLPHQTPQQKWGNFAGVYRWERVKVSFMLQKDHSLGWDVRCTLGAARFVRA